MPRKLLFDLRVKQEDGKVRLYFGKATPAYLADPENRKPLTVRIYRKEEPDFLFGRDYREYFDGIGAEDAKVIYEGQLPAADGRMYTYTDETARLGAVYAYWVSGGPGDVPTGPVPVRVRDEQIWWPLAKTTEYMERLAAEYPELVSLKSFGQTMRGRGIRGLFAGNVRNCIALVGLVHAGESGPELILPAAERILKEDSGLLQRAGLAILPAVNLDMRELQVQGDPTYLRTNFNGVDINRNFPADWDTIGTDYGQNTANPHVSTYRGEAPGSEPETRALMAFVKQAAPHGVFSFHSLASICGDAFLASKSAMRDSAYADACRTLLEPYSHGFSLGERYRLQLRYECTAGSLPSWLYLSGRRPAFDLEWDGRARSRIALADRTTRELLEEYQTRHYHGIRETLAWLQGEAEPLDAAGADAGGGSDE